MLARSTMKIDRIFLKASRDDLQTVGSLLTRSMMDNNNSLTALYKLQSSYRTEFTFVSQLQE